MPLLLIRSNQSYYVLLLLGKFARLGAGAGVSLLLLDHHLLGDLAKGGDLLVGLGSVVLAVELLDFCQICFKAGLFFFNFTQPEEILVIQLGRGDALRWRSARGRITLDVRGRPRPKFSPLPPAKTFLLPATTRVI